MKPLAILAASIVTLALTSYSVAIITEQIKRKVIGRVLLFLTLGVTLDITSTALMIIVSENSPFTLHGIMGYTSLTFMLVDAILLWRVRLKSGPGAGVPKRIHMYSRIAYIIWVLAYFTGTALVMMR